MATDGVTITHPNRDKASSKSTRVVISILLVISAVLIAVVLFGGWDLLEGMQSITIAYILLYLGAVILMIRWNRGVLPVIAALAIIFAIFCGVAAPEWFSRDKTGFDEAALSNLTLGMITAIIIPVQILLATFAMVGFRQAWNVEVERRASVEDDGPEPHSGPPTPAAPLPA